MGFSRKLRVNSGNTLGRVLGTHRSLAVISMQGTGRDDQALPWDPSWKALLHWQVS